MKKVNTLLGVAAVICFNASAVHAQHSVSLAAVVERIENPLLSNVSPGGVTLMRVIPNYAFETQGDRARSRLSLGAVLERSSNTLLVASRNFPSLGYTWAYSWPTADIELRANLAESATRNTQFAELGRITVDSRERSVVTGVLWNQELTARTRLTLDVANTRVSYDTASLEGYRELEMSSRFSWEATERAVYFFEPGYARLTASGTGAISTQARWVVGTRGVLTPDVSLTAFAGQARTQGSQISTGNLGALLLTFSGNRLSSGVEWSRDVAAASGSASGFLESETLGLSLGYRLMEGATVSASMTSSRSSGNEEGRGNVSSLTLENQLGASWSSTLGVEDRKFRGAFGPSGRGWAVRAGLVYAYPGR